MKTHEKKSRRHDLIVSYEIRRNLHLSTEPLFFEQSQTGRTRYTPAARFVASERFHGPDGKPFGILIHENAAKKGKKKKKNTILSNTSSFPGTPRVI